MRKAHLSLLAAVLVLTGAGCSLGGSDSSSVGGIFQSADGGAHWTATNVYPKADGVGSISGVDVTAIELDPQDSSTMYVGTAANGMLFSTDDGATWQRVEEDELRSGKVLAVEVDPRDVCTYFVLKSDRVLKTTTCGREFDTDVYVESRTEEALTSMVLDWYNPNIVWIGTTEGEVIRSTNGGDSWTRVTTVKGEVTAMTISNADSRIVMIGTESRSLYRSADSGVTWTEYEKTLKDFDDADTVYGFAQDADGSTVIMNTEFGLLRSTDKGSTWEAVSMLTGEGEVRVRALAVAPTDGDTIAYATDSAFYLTTSGGESTATSSLPSGHAGNVLVIDPNDEEHYILGMLAVEEK